MIILFLELLGAALIGYGIFLIAIPIGLIFVGTSVLLFSLTWERGSRKVKK